MTSQSQVMLPIVGALVAAEKELGRGRIWNPTTKFQETFLQEFFARWRKSVVNMKDMESICSHYAETINEFLEAHGFSIKLNAFEPNEFGAAAVFSLLVHWATEGKLAAFRAQDGKKYEAVSMPSDAVSYFLSPSHGHPVVKIAVTGADEIYMTKFSESIITPFTLISRAHQISRTLRPMSDFGRFIFPMVDLDQEVDISWLLGLGTVDSNGVSAWIAQAKQQTKLKMNCQGALMESAAAISVKRAVAPEKPEYELNEPFLFWCKRSGFSQAVFTAYVDYDAWKNPGSFHVPGSEGLIIHKGGKQTRSARVRSAG